MSSEMDPAKLKVVDLRQELSNRGLDTKGNKAVLVKRLKDALEKELKQDLPDTSIADTSTEEFDTSQTEEPASPKEQRSKPPDEKPKVSAAKSEHVKTEVSPQKVKTDVVAPQKAKSEVVSPKTVTNEAVSPQKSKESKKKESPAKEKTEEKVCEVPKAKGEGKVEENGDTEENEDEEKPSRKSRWTDEDKDQEEKPSEESEEEKDKKDDNEDQEKQPDVEMQEEGEQKGEKRKRESTSPGRSQRRRSKSPVKEDEPAIDNEKVQLSWYDSDLHLQLDKESFLSGKPLNEGAFGYIWAGARATHGISSGKVCYEVKLTEELKFEDFNKDLNRGRGDRERERYRTDHRRDDKGRDRRDRRDSDRSGKKSHDKKSDKKEDKEKTDEKDKDKEKSEEKDKDNAEEKQESDETVEKMETDEDKSAEKSAEDSEEPPSRGEDDKSESKEATEETAKPSEASEESQDTKGDSEEKPEKSEEDKDKQKDDPEKMETEDAKPEEAKPEEPPTEPIPERMFRVGFSLLNTALQLGEEKYSFAYESSGKFATNKEFKDFGATFGVGDVVGAFLSIDDEDVTFKFTVNGALQPETITVPRSEFPEENFALFPHVLSRNYAFEINLGDKEEPWFPVPEELAEYQFLSKVEEKVAGPVRPETRSECETILMIGLPHSGKTHWVNEHILANPDKRYTIIGNSSILNRMTVSGEPLKSRFKGRWFYLIDRMQFCLNKITDIASVRRRNYILDRPHVFPSQQRRKLRQFEGFKRRAVVVVVSDEEQARREALVEDKSPKDDTVLDMKATFGVPNKEEDFIDEVTYAGAAEEETKEIIKKYNEVGKAAGYGTRKPFQRRNYPQNNYRDRGYQRYDRRPPPPPPTWGRQGQGGRGGWNRDRRDNRGPPPDRNWGGRNIGGNRPPDRSRDAGRSPGGGGFNRNRPAVSGGGGAGRQGGGNWGGNWGGQGNWQQGYGNYGQGQGGWGGQGQGAQGQNWKYGGQGQGGYGGGYGGNWNYYNQYSQAQQNWNQGQSAVTGGGGGGGAAGGGQPNYSNYTQQAWAQFARQYAQQQQAQQAAQQKHQERRK